MSEAFDELTLNIAGGGELVLNRRNTRLYTFLGENATRNHVFVEMERNEETAVTTGTYIFSHANSFPAIVQFIAQHAFPMTLNSLEVPACDETAFQRSLDQIEQAAGEELGDYLPDDWR